MAIAIRIRIIHRPTILYQPIAVWMQLLRMPKCVRLTVGLSGIHSLLEPGRHLHRGAEPEQGQGASTTGRATKKVNEPMRVEPKPVVCRWRC